MVGKEGRCNVTAAEFMKIIGLIRGAYPHIDRFQDNDVKDVWYECLQDLDFDTAREATVNVIKATKDFPPDIAKIREEYGYLKEQESTNNGQIKTYYQYARGSYPIAIPDGTGWDIWKERAKDGRQAELFYKVIQQYLLELNGDAIDFETCLKTICRDRDGKIFFKDTV